MGSRFQPQNTPSQNQIGPSLYPALLPVQNPQYQPPTQHCLQRYPQNYLPRNPTYNPSVGHGIHVPLANYENESNQGLDAEKMRELERRLDTCFIKCYQSWLWLTIIFCGMSIFKTFVTLVSTTEQSDALVFTYGSLLYTIWAILQSVFGIQAVSQKNLTKANVACWMMVIYVLPSIIGVIWLVVAIFNHVSDPNDARAYFWDVSMYIFLIGAMLNTLFGIFVNLVGALKVRKILSEKNTLQERIDRSEDSIHA